MPGASGPVNYRISSTTKRPLTPIWPRMMSSGSLRSGVPFFGCTHPLMQRGEGGADNRTVDVGEGEGEMDGDGKGLGEGLGGVGLPPGWESSPGCEAQATPITAAVTQLAKTRSMSSKPNARHSGSFPAVR